MWSWERRRSPRIVELNARREEKEKNHIKGKETLELPIKRDLGEESFYSKSRRKKLRIRPVKDLVGDAIENQVEKAAGSFIGEDHEIAENQAGNLSSTAGMQERSKLEFLLGILQRRDSRGLFAKPVDPSEVESYYDVIKEPMDFGTILLKLNGGCYKSLEEFESDIFLVAENALLFNASNTIYYRQALAIKELAQKLFHALKTDPEHFETKFSGRKLGSSTRTKAEGKLLDFKPSRITEFETASKGSKDKGKSGYLEGDRRQTYKPWTSLLNEKELMASKVYNDYKALERDVNNPVNYHGSLNKFIEDLGPTAKMVARRMAERCFAEDVMITETNSNQQHQTPKNPIPYAESSTQKDISIASSLKLHEHSAGSKHSSIQIDSLKGQKGSMLDMINEREDLGSVMAHASSRQTLGGMQRMKNPSVGMDFTSTSYEEALRKSKGKNVLGGEITEAEETTETIGDFQKKKVETMGEGLGRGNSFKVFASNQNTGIQVGSSFHVGACGDETVHYSSQWNTNSNLNKFSSSNLRQHALNVGQTTEAGSLQLRTPFAPSGYGGVSSFSSLWPYKGTTEGLSRNQQRGNLEQGKIPSLFQPVELGSQAMVDGRFQRQSKSSNDWLQQKPRLNGYKLSDQAAPSPQQSWANKPASGGGLYHIQGIANKGHPRYGANSNQEDRLSKLCKPVELRPRTMVDGCFQQQSKLPGGGLQLRSRYDGADLSGQDVLSRQENWAINPTSGGGLHQVQGIGQGGGSGSKGNLKHGGQASNWLKEVELRSQPIVDSHFQQQAKSSEVNSSHQTGQKQHGWNITPSDGEGMKASKAYNFEMCQTPRQGESSIGAPPSYDQRQPPPSYDQKQPFPDANLLKWLLEN